MPVHDWTRVEAGVFHEFHGDWIFTLKNALNQGVLPPDYYAMGEQVAGGLLPDIVSPGNNASRHAFSSFVQKSLELLDAGIHLLILDLLPPGPRDPQGIHGAICAEMSNVSFELPADRKLTLAAYAAGVELKAFVDPVAVGQPLPDMPLFLEPEIYVKLPLESSYQDAFAAVPRYWREVLA